MSRAYRIRVRESLRHVIRAGDEVQSQLELLEILPSLEMAELLAHELAGLGFQRDGKLAIRQDGETIVTVDLETGAVRVKVEKKRQVKTQGERQGVIYDDVGPSETEAKRELKQALRKDLENSLDQHREQLQEEATEALVGVLADVRAELNRGVNRATAEALKRKAAQLGQVKHLSEDREAGSLTIVLEV